MVISNENCRDYCLIYDDASAAYRYAAESINKYIYEVCGFELSIGNRKKFISIGLNNKSREIIERYNHIPLKTDGFRIVFENECVYIFGDCEKGTIYGVYEFIERFLGIRWLNCEKTYIPSKKGIAIKEENLLCEPYFPQRIFLNYDSIFSQETAMHMRFSGNNIKPDQKYGVKQLWFDRIPDPHNSLYYVPPEKYIEKHPEFYCINKMRTMELCYSNGIKDDYTVDETMSESVVKIAAESLFRFIKESRDAKYFMFGKQDDANAVCHCEVCERRRRELGGESGLNIIFLNCVIEIVEEMLERDNIDSDFNLVMLAYHSTADPPVGEIFKVLPNKRMHIRYAPIEADYTYPLLDKRQSPSIYRQLSGWTSLTPNIMIWDYQCNYAEYLWYFANAANIEKNLRDYARYGMSYVLNQGAYNCKNEWQSDMKAYAVSKMYWNINIPIMDLYREYVDLFFEEAADYVWEFIVRNENFFAEKIKKGFKLPLFQDDESFFNYRNYPLNFLLENKKIIDNAISAAENAIKAVEKKEIIIKTLKFMKLTAERMILRNEYDYFPEGNESLSKDFFDTAKALGVNKTGEGTRLFIDIVKDSKCHYKIVLSSNPSSEERFCAEKLKGFFSKKYGFDLPIVNDNEVLPMYGEKAICIGNNFMFGEFYKNGVVSIEDYDYFVDVRGCCVFITAAEDYKTAFNVFCSFLDDEKIDGVINKVTIPARRKFHKRILT